MCLSNMRSYDEVTVFCNIHARDELTYFLIKGVKKMISQTSGIRYNKIEIKVP